MKYLFINSVAGFGSTGRIAAEQCRERMAHREQSREQTVRWRNWQGRI